MSALFGRLSPVQSNVMLTVSDAAGNRSRVSRTMPNPNVSLLGHCIMAVVFYGLFIAYVVVSSIEFANMPPTTTFAIEAANQFPALTARIAVQCKSAATEPCGLMHLTVNYSQFTSSPCYESGAVVVSSVASPSTSTSLSATGGVVANLNLTQVASLDAPSHWVDVPLCFTKQESLQLSAITGNGSLPISMVHVGFIGLNNTASAAMTVEVFYAGVTTDPSKAVARRMINVNQDNSVKVVPLSGVVETFDSAIASFTPIAELVEFEGFRPAAAGKRSDVLVVMQSLVRHRTREYTATMWDHISNLGSAFETLMMAMFVVGPLWAFLFAIRGQRSWITAFMKKNSISSSKAATAATGAHGASTYEEPRTAAMAKDVAVEDPSSPASANRELFDANTDSAAVGLDASWRFDVDAGYWWSEEAQLYYDPLSRMYGDPANGAWYDPESGRWV